MFELPQTSVLEPWYLKAFNRANTPLFCSEWSEVKTKWTQLSLNPELSNHIQSPWTTFHSRPSTERCQLLRQELGRIQLEIWGWEIHWQNNITARTLCMWGLYLHILDLLSGKLIERTDWISLGSLTSTDEREVFSQTCRKAKPFRIQILLNQMFCNLKAETFLLHMHYYLQKGWGG